MMKRLAVLFLVTIAIPAVAPAGDDPEPPAPKVEAREIRVKVALQSDGRHDAPYRVKTKKELADLLTNERLEATILKKVDFGKEHLLIFWWLGSGGDQLTLEGKGGVLTFSYQPGENPGNNRHAKLYAIPARAKVKVVTK